MKLSDASREKLEQELSAANTLIKTKEAELDSLQSQLDRERSNLSDVQADNTELKQKIDDLENAKAELKRKISETEKMVKDLEVQKRELDSEIEVRTCLDIISRTSLTFAIMSIDFFSFFSSVPATALRYFGKSIR